MASTSLSALNADSQKPLAADQLREDRGFGAGGNNKSGEHAWDEDPALSASTKSNAASNGSESQRINLHIWLAVGLFLCILALGIPFLVRRIFKSVQNNEVCFQGLQTDQIVAKIKNKT
jgi:hypothetical protein